MYVCIRMYVLGWRYGESVCVVCACADVGRRECMCIVCVCADVGRRECMCIVCVCADVGTYNKNAVCVRISTRV